MAAVKLHQVQITMERQVDQVAAVPVVVIHQAVLVVQELLIKVLLAVMAATMVRLMAVVVAAVLVCKAQ